MKKLAVLALTLLLIGPSTALLGVAALGGMVAASVARADGRRRAAEREVPVAIYTHDLFSTGKDEDNRAAAPSDTYHY